MATVAGIVVHSVGGFTGWTTADMSTGFSRSDTIDHSSC